tara:strand:- start:145 stop:1161 length:1017 start_codon:yes stop_codon:yes gene_type:complete
MSDNSNRLALIAKRRKRKKRRMAKKNKENNHYNFSGFLWGPSLEFANEILEYIHANYSVLHYYNYDFKNKNTYNTSILDIYTTDDIDPKKVKNVKLKALSDYPLKYVYFKFYIKDPLFRKKGSSKKNISTVVEKIKKKIREKYKTKLTHYVHDIIIHITDNFQQTNQIEDIMKKYNTNKRSECINLKYFLKCNYINNIFNRVDTLVRKYSIEQYLKNPDYDFGLYKKMQFHRTKKTQKHKVKNLINYVNDFKKLINSIKNNGFNNEYPIKYSLHYLLRDGSHRLSYLLILKPTFIKIEHLKWDNHKTYSMNWFKNQDFSSEELSIINNEITNLDTFLN